MADHVPTGVLRLLDARDGRHCIWTATDGPTVVPQHRQGGMGGRKYKHRLANLLWLDSILNGLIKDHADLQATATAWGIAISLHADPEQIPVFRPHAHQWFRLTGNVRIPITAGEALERMVAFYGPEYHAMKAVADGGVRAEVLARRGGW